MGVISKRTTILMICCLFHEIFEPIAVKRIKDLKPTKGIESKYVTAFDASVFILYLTALSPWIISKGVVISVSSHSRASTKDKADRIGMNSCVTYNTRESCDK